MIPKRLCILFGSVALPASVHADIFAREDFNYSNGNLAGDNGGVGWSAAWTNAQGTPTVAASKGLLNAINNDQGSRLISTLQTAPVGGTRTVWISFEGKQTTTLTGTTNSYGGLGLYRGNTEQLLIGKAWPGPYEWRAGVGGSLVGASTPVSTLNTTKIIARVTLVDGTATANDTLDVWLNPMDTSSVAALGAPQITRTDADLSFDTLRIRSGSGAGGTEGWAFDAVAAGDDLADVVAADSDGDGMLDAWEIAHGLIVGLNDAGLDPDSDGLTNLQEYLRSTDPQSYDTDGDGLSDGVETGTGVFVSASNTGTNPLVIDTDNDGLLDSMETGTGVFVDDFDPGTNPNKADTDGDGLSDSYEISHGSNPNSAASVPPTGDLTIIGAENFSYDDGPVAGLNGGNGFDFDNSTTPDAFIGHMLMTSDWNDQFGTSLIVSGKLRTMESGAKREFNGPGQGATVGGDEYTGAVNDAATSASHKVYFRADLTRQAGATWSGISSFDFGIERSFAGVPTAVNPASGKYEFAIGTPSPTPVYSGISPVDGTTYTLVVKLDYDTDLISLWVNPDLTGSEPTPSATAPFTLVNWTTAARLGSGGTGATDWDNFVVSRQWSALGTFPGVANADYNAWISKYPAVGTARGFLDDPDHDGLSNGLESLLDTDPSIPGQGTYSVSFSSPAGKFRHTRSKQIPSDVSASYEWSSDLRHWQSGGTPNENGATVAISSEIAGSTSPSHDEIEVSYAVISGVTNKIFIRLKAVR